MAAALEVRNLSKVFNDKRGRLQAVKGVSFQVQQGQCFGIVGESGSGKSTVARLIMQLLQADEGEILLEGRTLKEYRVQKEWYRRIQMVFQSPADSFNPRITLGESVMSPMVHFGCGKKEAREKMDALFERVKLPASYAGRYPHEVSGGECQRAAIARALSIGPKVLVCDEATSALDVTVQAEEEKLLRQLQDELKISILFISHDLGLVQELCSEMIVMCQGKVEERGRVDEVIESPKSAYTQMLIDSVLGF